MNAVTQPQSRRHRPAKAPLSREWIIAETIKIMKSEGLAKATMRRVAEALDTGAASLYVYVANTAELHAAVLDELIGSLTYAEDGHWQARLEDLLDRYAALLHAHPGLARSALVLRPTGPNTVRLYDALLGLLLEARIPVDRAAWGVNLLLQHVTAGAAEHSASSPDDIDARDEGRTEMSAMEHSFRTGDPKAVPYVAEHVDALFSGTPAQRTTWAIRVIVAGIAATATR